MLLAQRCSGLCPLQKTRLAVPSPLATCSSIGTKALVTPSHRKLAVGISHRSYRRQVVLAANVSTNGAQPEPFPEQQQPQSHLPPIIQSSLKLLGSVAFVCVAACSGLSRPAYAKPSSFTTTPAVVLDSEGRAVTPSSGYVPYDETFVGASRVAGSIPSRQPGNTEERTRAFLEANPHVDAVIRTEKDLQQALEKRKQEILRKYPELRDSGILEQQLADLKGVPVGFDEMMKSSVYDPRDVPVRKTKAEIYQQINSIMNQYDDEDFDLGIKQFLMEDAIEQAAESAGGKTGGKSFEEQLGQELFKDESQQADRKKTEDVVDDAFTTEAAEEAITLFGEPGALRTAWRVQENLTELSYTQLWALIGENQVEKVRYYGPDKRAVLVTTKESAPGGARVRKVTLPPDEALLGHMAEHGVFIDTGVLEEDRLKQAFWIQVLRYTFPFMFISAVFWLLHTWILDPLPNQFRRREFIRYRREILQVGSKLNFRSPARQVRIDTDSPDFISWDDINGIDEVKQEIQEIIDYLKNPGLLRLRGVARIGGVLLAGSPGTGKTLLAKAIAAESGVTMFTCSGTDFYDVYTGVGARRIRETFEKMRNFAPAILFIDEFDALGAARGSASGGDESASIINEMLVQMDGFEDNRGIVVLGATNRPGAIDSALIRPGRFDRIIYMPLPDATGRAKILQVHARNKAVDPSINWYEVARAMAGFTGADCMGLMARAARMAARQGRELIVEEDIYAAMENKAMESYQQLSSAPTLGEEGVADPIPPGLRKAIATYEAGKALMAYITPEFDEIARTSICPYGMITGYTLFVEDEERSAGAILTRSDMEAHMVVNLAGRCSEKLVMGESEVTGLGVQDMFHANMIAREMVLAAGMGPKMGPVDLMHVVAQSQDNGVLLRNNDPRDANDSPAYYHSTDMSMEQSRVALAEVIELLEAAEAKAYYGLAINWKPLEALSTALLERGVLQGKEVAHILETNGVIHFPDPYLQGFGWDDVGELVYPFKPRSQQAAAAGAAGAAAGQQQPGLTGLAAKTWFAGTEQDAPRGPDGKFRAGWHWGMPYTIKRDLPDWFMKEVERYAY